MFLRHDRWVQGSADGRSLPQDVHALTPAADALAVQLTLPCLWGESSKAGARPQPCRAERLQSLHCRCCVARPLPAGQYRNSGRGSATPFYCPATWGH